ncbi:MAG: EAL domain-containing protein [Acidobacteriota bacterium]
MTSPDVPDRAARIERRWTVARHALDAVDDAVLILDTDGRVAIANPAAEHLLGRSGGALLGQSLGSLLSLRDGGGEPIDLEASVDRCAALELAHDTSLRRPDGELRQVHGLLSTVESDPPDPKASRCSAVLVLRETGAQQRLNQTLQRATRFDSLTGLLNRDAFDAHLQSALFGEPRRSTARGDADEGGADSVPGWTLGQINLRQFEAFLETSGHAAGDMLLQWVASLVRETVAGDDVVARVGRASLGVLLQGDVGAARQVIGAIHEALGTFRFVWAGEGHRVDLSVGLVAVDPQVGGIEEHLDAAEKAAGLAGRSDRSQVEVYHPDDDEIREHRGEMSWVMRVRQAVDAGAFNLVWQRILPLGADVGSQGVRSSESGSPLLFEVLLRLADRGDGRPPGGPAEFLPVAERYGLMPAIDRWVISNALREMARLEPDDAARLELVTVNLSGASLADPRLIDFVERELETSGVDPSRVAFEITETAAISNLRRAAETMEALRRHGVRWALDDFGSGMSSFGYLRELPVDLVKIDGSIVLELLRSPLSRAVVESIHRIARVLGARTVAEHVEDVAMIDELRRLGIDFAQGYWIGRPCPIGELPAVAVLEAS